jgi:hypothetical protein
MFVTGWADPLRQTSIRHLQLISPFPRPHCRRAIRVACFAADATRSGAGFAPPRAKNQLDLS